MGKRAPRRASADIAAAKLRTNFGANLRAARERAGMTQAAVSAASGIDANSISRTELGTGNLTMDVAVRLAAAVRTDLNDLLGLSAPAEATEGVRHALTEGRGHTKRFIFSYTITRKTGIEAENFKDALKTLEQQEGSEVLGSITGVVIEPAEGKQEPHRRIEEDIGYASAT